MSWNFWFSFKFVFFLFLSLHGGFLLVVLRALWSFWSVKNAEAINFYNGGRKHYIFCPLPLKIASDRSLQAFFFFLAIFQTRVYCHTEVGHDLGSAVVKRYVENWYTKILNKLLLQMYLFNLLKPTGHVMNQQFNPLNTKRRLLYLKTQFVPRS